MRGLMIVCCLCLVDKTIYNPAVIKVSVRTIEMAVPFIENAGASRRFKIMFRMENNANTVM